MTDAQYFKVLRTMYTSPNFTLGKIKKNESQTFCEADDGSWILS